MNRGRNGGAAGLVTQIAMSALAARIWGALPFLFHRTSHVLRGMTSVIIPSFGLRASGVTSTRSPGAMGL